MIVAILKNAIPKQVWLCPYCCEELHSEGHNRMSCVSCAEGAGCYWYEDTGTVKEEQT